MCTSRLSTAVGWSQKRSQTVEGLLGQNSRWLESEKVANSRETVGSELARVLRELSQGARQGVRQGCLQLVRWNPKGRKQSRNCSLHLCSNFLTGSGVRQSFPDFLSEI